MVVYERKGKVLQTVVEVKRSKSSQVDESSNGKKYFTKESCAPLLPFERTQICGCFFLHYQYLEESKNLQSAVS